MKIILSRKGFDSGYGGAASPILPDGRIVSLPIPEPRPAIASVLRRYRQIRADASPTTVRLVSDLTKGRIAASDPAHLDPDLDAGSVPRARGWKPVFGQTSTAQSHLQNLGVKPGDVFLFFGWFRRVEHAAGKYRYLKNAPDLHVCFGWLQVGQILPVVPLSGLPGWLKGHPHHKHPPYHRPECIYVAAQRLNLPKLATHLPGGGILRTYQRKRCLTAPGQTRRFWQLPPWFYPTPPKPPPSYHSRASFTRLPGGDVLLASACIGQEFVLDCSRHPQAIPWLVNLLT